MSVPISPTNVHGRQNRLRTVARGTVIPGTPILTGSSSLSGCGLLMCKRPIGFDRLPGAPMDFHWRYANSSAWNLPTKWAVLAVLVRSGLESALIWIYRR